MLSHPEFLYLWMFVIGSVIGSFLNVVIYRLPRGMSLLHPGSSCPQCGHLIRWFDNVPLPSSPDAT
jgi:leader peptidase (prepilin peptidase)/N-methyltransferase